MSAYPLVSVGVPVRNGAGTLARALDSIVRQTYTNLEVIISDNQSTDGTEAVCREYAARDSRIRYMRQRAPLGIIDNFRVPVDASRGDFFLWAAHDDVRDDDYVETLLRGFARHPEASLCFGDMAEFSVPMSWEAAEPVQHTFQTLGLSFVDFVRQQTQTACAHIYGVIRTEHLRQYRWYEVDEGWDVAALFWLAMRGPFVAERGTTLYYFRPPAGRSTSERAVDNNFRPLSPWWREQLAWACASAAVEASAASGRPLSCVWAFTIVYWHILQGFKGLLCRVAPRPLLTVYRRVTRRRNPAAEPRRTA